MSPSDTIRQYIRSKVDGLWTSSAMNWIERVLSTNKSFVQSVSNPKLKTKDGHVVRFECDAVVNIPDAGKVGKATILYTFNPRAKKAHHVELKTA